MDSLLPVAGGVAGLLTALGGLLAVLVQWRRARAQNQTDASGVAHANISDALAIAETRRQDIAELRAERAALDERVNRLEEELRAALARVEQAEEELRAARVLLAELAELQRRVAELERVNGQLRVENTALQAGNAQLRTELMTERRRTTQLTTRVRHLEEQLLGRG